MIHKNSVQFHKLIEIITTILDARDPYTFEHSWRVAKISEELAVLAGLDKEKAEMVHIAAHLHDIGKIGVPDKILNKSGPLTNSEYNVIKTHSKIGYNIVTGIAEFKEVSLNILYHHERWDGKGYPAGLAKKEIPIGARIIAIADAFDSLTSKRTYRNPVDFESAYAEILRCRETQFCPEITDAFCTLQSKMPQIIDSVNNEIELRSSTLQVCSIA